MLENLRERLHMVQQDFSSGLTILGEKTRENKIRGRSRLEDYLPHSSAGLDILNRYEESWFLLHKRTKDSAQAAEAVDGDIVMLSAHWERRRTALTQLQEQLQSLPAFTSELDVITTNIAHLEGDFEELESRLVYLETLCCQCEQQTFKQHHMSQLEAYKRKKRRELNTCEVELNSKHARKVAEVEQAMQQKLRERQKVYEEAFNQDMKQYLSTGYLQQRGAPAEADACVLDQMSVTNVSDQEALDDFLNSPADDISTSSSLTSGPDLESHSESSRSQMNQTPPANNQDAVWEHVEEAASVESDEPLVQSDEEDIQPEALLLGQQELSAVRDRDGSDVSG